MGYHTYHIGIIVVTGGSSHRSQFTVACVRALAVDVAIQLLADAQRSLLSLSKVYNLIYLTQTYFITAMNIIQMVLFHYIISHIDQHASIIFDVTKFEMFNAFSCFPFC